jgi:hypothetical protein
MNTTRRRSVTLLAGVNRPAAYSCWPAHITVQLVQCPTGLHQAPSLGDDAPAAGPSWASWQTLPGYAEHNKILLDLHALHENTTSE